MDGSDDDGARRLLSADAGTAEDRLVYYANQFPIVEVDATYYALPARRTGELWMERTPPDFTFDIKAHALMTGQPSEPSGCRRTCASRCRPRSLEQKRVYARDLPDEIEDEIWARFADGIEPLRSSGKLGAVFLQYPRWFFPSNESRDEIVTARERLGDTPFAVELRHASWLNEKNARPHGPLLREVRDPVRHGRRAAGDALVAAADDAWSRRRRWRSCASTAGAPRPGRSRASRSWSASATSTSRMSSVEWVPRIREAAEQVPEIHLLMNNCYANYGTTNAREIADLLASEVPRLDR